MSTKKFKKSKEEIALEEANERRKKDAREAASSTGKEATEKMLEKKRQPKAKAKAAEFGTFAKKQTPKEADKRLQKKACRQRTR